MASKYKLTYFNLRGLAESIRFVLSYMDEEFEDVRVEFGDWPSKKSTTPFGKMPLLEVDGKTLTQSVAILRYLGKKAGLGGADDWENLQIDIIADTITDLRMPTTTFLMEPNEDLKKSRKETFLKETMPFYLKKLDDVVKENGGYLANKKLSWVDFMFAAISEFLSFVSDSEDATADYPNLHSLRKKVFSLPQIKKWRDTRPTTPF